MLTIVIFSSRISPVNFWKIKSPMSIELFGTDLINSFSVSMFAGFELGGLNIRKMFVGLSQVCKLKCTY